MGKISVELVRAERTDARAHGRVGAGRTGVSAAASVTVPKHRAPLMNSTEIFLTTAPHQPETPVFLKISVELVKGDARG